MFPRLAALLATLALASVASAALPAADAPLCRAGQRQSPIALSTLAKSGGERLQFYYQPEALRLANDGHTVRVRFSKGGYLQLGASRYRLQQLHFHTPGGDTLDGEVFPMSAHLLHRGPKGELLAVVVLFRLAAENPALTGLWPHIPDRPDGDHTVPGRIFSAGSVLPKGTGYLRYSGSLTANPCTENVMWFVMKQPVQISAGQLQTWKSRFGDNIRGPQPLNGRAVEQGD